MKYFLKSLTLIFVALSVLSVGSSSVSATNVGGIIGSDTTWAVSGSPYELTDDIHISDNATLTIKPGVTIEGNDHSIVNAGTISAQGTFALRIVFENIVLNNADGKENAIIDLDNCDLKTSCSFPELFDDGSLVITNSWLRDLTLSVAISGGGGFVESSETAEIRKNILENVTITYTTDSDIVFITNNIFAGSSKIISAGGQADIRYNSFINTSSTVIEIEWYYGLGSEDNDSVAAANNFWNTQNTEIIDSMIYDANDPDFNTDIYINYDPILTEPHPNTPEDLTLTSNDPVYHYNYYLPFFKGDDNYWTGIGLKNLSKLEEVDIKVIIYDGDGTVQAIESNSLPKRGQDTFVVGKGLSDPKEGWIRINSSQQIGGLCFVGTSRSGEYSYMADVPFIVDTSDYLEVPHVAQGPKFDTSILASNPNNSQTMVTLRFVDQDGNEPYDAIQIVIPANGSFKYDISRMVPDPETPNKGSVEISADQGIVAFGLFNDLKNVGGYSYSGINAVDPDLQ